MSLTKQLRELFWQQEKAKARSALAVAVYNAAYVDACAEACVSPDIGLQIWEGDRDESTVDPG